MERTGNKYEKSLEKISKWASKKTSKNDDHEAILHKKRH